MRLTGSIALPVDAEVHRRRRRFCQSAIPWLFVDQYLLLLRAC